jgi:hypothetical protein
MGLSIVASFVDPTEAKVAAGALCSAGFNAVVLDQNFSSVDWMASQALGGIRVGVPDAELDEAAGFLREMIEDRPEPAPDPYPGGLWRTAAIVFGAVLPLVALLMIRPEKTWQVVILLLGGLGVPLGWFIAAAGKSRHRREQFTAILNTGLLLAGIMIAIFAIGALIEWLPRVLYPGGRG